MYQLFLFAFLVLSAAALPVDPSNYENRMQLESKKKNVQQLVAANCQNKFSLKKVCLMLPQEIGAIAGSGVVSVLASYCSQTFNIFNTVDEQTIRMQQVMMVSNAMQSTISTSIERIFQLIGNCKLTKAEGLQKVHSILKKETKAQADSLPDAMKKVLQTQDAEIEGMIAGLLNHEETESFRNVIRRLEFRQAVVLGLPTSPKNIAAARNKKNVKESVKALIEDVPKDEQDTMREFVKRVQDNSIVRNPDKAMIYLFGQPGTGKSHFGKRIGKVLGLPMCELDLKDKNLRYQFQGKFSLERQVHLQSDDVEGNEVEDAVGAIVRCMLLTGVTNPIIFIDEAGKLLSRTYDADIEFLKKLTEQSQSTVFVHLFDSDIDISRVTFIFAGNYEIGELALRSRIPQITFGPMSRGQRDRIFKNALAKAGDNLEEVISDKGMRRQIIRETNKFKEFILDKDEENPGVRILISVTRALVGHLRVLVEDDLPIDKAKVEAFILKTFDSYGSGQTMDTKADSLNGIRGLRNSFLSSGAIEVS